MSALCKASDKGCVKGVSALCKVSDKGYVCSLYGIR